MSRNTSPRDRSPSPYSQYSRTQSPSRTYKYSDSFDSEDSGQDTRLATPASRRKKNHSVHSNYSTRDSRGTQRITSKSYSSATYYGKTKKKGPPKVNNTRKVGNNNRSQSLASLSSQSPRRTTEVTQRMLSAKGHTISRLRNEIEEIRIKCDEAVQENRLLKQVQRRQERALSKFQDDEAELPQLLKKHSAELDNLHRRVRKYQQKEKDSEKRMKDQHQQLIKTKDQLEKLQDLNEDKGLKDRDELRILVQRLEDDCHEKDKRLKDLEKYTSNMKKNHRREEHEWRIKEADMKRRLQTFEMEREDLINRLREKEKELDVRNIYAQRVSKGNLKPSPTLRPLSVSKGTDTEDLGRSNKKQSPREPTKQQSPRELSKQQSPRNKTKSDLIDKNDSIITDNKTNSENKGTRSLKNSIETTKMDEDEIIVKKEETPKKEVSEHERILQDLDLGLKPLKEKEGSGEKKKEREDSLKVLKMLDADVSKRQENKTSNSKNEKIFGGNDSDVYKPTWLFGGDAKKADDKKDKKEQLLKELRSSKENSMEASKSGEEEAFPFFGSTKKAEEKKGLDTMVHSVRDLHRYSSKSREEKRDESAELDDLLFKSNSKSSSQKPANQYSDYQKKKELLLAKMKEIDNSTLDKDTGNGNSASSSGRSRSPKEYQFTEPVENLHNGKPSHPEEASPKSIKKSVSSNRQGRRGSNEEEDLEEIAFGDYAPSFGSKKAETKQPKNSFFDNDSNEDFWSSSKDKKAESNTKNKPLKNSFGGGSIFSTTIKAKPVSAVSDGKTLPWETSSNPDKNKVASQSTGNSLFATQTYNQQKSPYTSKPLTTAGSDDIDDDIEEFIL